MGYLSVNFDQGTGGLPVRVRYFACALPVHPAAPVTITGQFHKCLMVLCHIQSMLYSLVSHVIYPPSPVLIKTYPCEQQYGLSFMSDRDFSEDDNLALG